MTKEDIKHTHVWKVNKDMVVADTIEDAIEVYRNYYEFPYNKVTSVEEITYYRDTALISHSNKSENEI